MPSRTRSLLAGCALLALALSGPSARADARWFQANPEISFIEYQSLDLTQQPPAPLTVKAKLKIPTRINGKPFKRRVPAVVVMHGSGGVDARGDFYARALNAAGIATLEMDMWEARDLSGGTDRPPLPLFTYPDAFGALAYLASRPEIDPDRIGALGFSWGGVIAVEAATEIYTQQFGNGRRFRALVAHYPVCYAYNSGAPGTEFGSNSPIRSNPLTGAPLLIQIGENDAYDQGSAPCLALKANLPPAEQALVEVVPYADAYHAWDRLMIPLTVIDPFARLGLGGPVEVIPNVEQAHRSLEKVVTFFEGNL